MRQAGRYLPEYRAIRGECSFLELCKRIDACVQISLLPRTILDVDAVIVFSDILIPLEAMGLQVQFSEEGPVILNPVAFDDDVKRLKTIDPTRDTPVIMDTLEKLSNILTPEFPLIGFSGAPFTLATYAIEGKIDRAFTKTKRLMYERPALFRRLIRRLAKMVLCYCEGQIRAGANCIQLFDTWGGILGADAYREFLYHEMQIIFKGLRKYNVPLIFYVNGGCHLLPLLKTVGADVMSVDWRTPIQEARRILGENRVIQGNLDPEALFLPPAKLRRLVEQIIQDSGGGKKFIFNVGHGLVPDTPVQNVKKVVQWVKRHRISR